jgi:hypothetical protein
MDCKCDGWKNSIDQVINAEVLMNLSHDIKYTEEPFKYCPWCGLELEGECSGCEHNLGGKE